MTSRSGRPALSNESKGSNVLSSRWIAFKFLQEFAEAFFLMVALESLLGEEEVWSARLV